MSDSGTISGAPTQGGWFGFDATVRDSGLQSDTLSLGIFIKWLAVTTLWLPPAYQNEPYSQMLQADGGQPPFVWGVGQGATLPPGMNLGSTGEFSGTPAASGNFPFVVNVQGSTGQTAAGNLSLFVASPLAITTSRLAEGNIGTPYSAALEATGGVGGYEWSLEAGSSLPDGVNLQAWGSISGVPITSGTFDFVARVTDWGSPRHTATQALTVFIDSRLTILPTTQPEGIVTRAYNYTLQALGGTPPYTWSIVGGNTAGVFAINPSSGELSGTPQINQDGTYVLNIQVGDASSPIQTATRDFEIHVLPPPNFLTTSLPDGSPDVDYYASILIEGGRTPHTVRVVSGSLPQGLTLSDPSFYGHFQIAGRPSSSGTFSFTLELADATSPPLTATQEFQLQISERLAITTTSLPNGSYTEPYNAVLTATGGVPPYVWSGSLPQDLVLDPATGEVFGYPITWGSNMLASITVRDSAVFPQTARRSFTMTINSVLRIHTSLLPPVRLGAPFAVELRAYGGSGTYNWRIASGRLPEGLILNSSTGEIVGTPTAEENQTFALRVDDTGSPAQFDERALTLRVLREPRRNDAITTATPLSDGRYQASLSPVADPISGPANPDTDYYRLTALPGSVVVIETETQDPALPSPADLVMEILNADGERLPTCRMMEDYGGLYDDPCLNDDSAFGTDLDPKLRLRVVGTPGTPVTFFLHILDWTGNARPDLTYYLYIFGTN